MDCLYTKYDEEFYSISSQTNHHAFETGLAYHQQPWCVVDAISDLSSAQPEPALCWDYAADLAKIEGH